MRLAADVTRSGHATYIRRRERFVIIGALDEDDAEATATLAEPVVAKKAKPRQAVPSVLLDRYEIVEEIGHGGMGVVYRARDKQLARDVAVKLVLTKDGADNAETHAGRLMREAQALAQLAHPNVVAVYDVGQIEGGVFIAMELVSGIPGDVWLREPRAWPEVLRVFRDAGRGLAAAHAVGLVHRDFKPANLIVGDDGRVRVLDFGLARIATLAAGLDTSMVTPSTPIPSDDVATAQLVDGAAPWLLDTPLTQVGTMVGTPPFMAPEQHRGLACDARSDQFSFCVALYRGLYGERPFAGKTFGELRTNSLAGAIRPAPTGADVPAWLRAIVVRGLGADPATRWPTMTTLIDVLGRDPQARRRRIAVTAAAAIALAGVVGVVSWRVFASDPPADPCSGGERELVGVWDATARSAIETAFGKTAKPYAAAAEAAVARAFDGYAARWTTMRTEACTATHVRGTQSAELLDLRMACLARRRESLRALAAVFATADADLVSRASDATRALPPLDDCADVEALRLAVPPPTDPQIRARAKAADRSLAKVTALTIAGRYPEARLALTPIIAEAQAIGWRPLEGEARLADARLADSSGAYADAAKAYREAAIAAEAGRDDETAALARIGLVWVTGERLGRYAEAQELARDAAATIERLGHRELLTAALDQNVAALFLEQGNFAEAETRSRHVLAIRQKLLAPDDPTIATALGDLGDVAAQTARWDDAIDDYQRALVIAERGVGPDHPLCATLRINLGAALHNKGRDDDALVELDKARTISERALGPDHAQLATIASNAGAIMLDHDRVADAAVQFRRARDIWTRSLGADHPDVATAEFHLGEVAMKQGHPADAAVSFGKALAVWQAKLGADHPSLAAALSGLAETALAQHHPAEALAYDLRALAILEKALGPTHAALGDILIAVGSAQVALGKPRLARAALERALAIREASDDPIDLARARFALARVLDDAIRARKLATEARTAFAAGGASHASETGEVARWLARR